MHNIDELRKVFRSFKDRMESTGRLKSLNLGCPGVEIDLMFQEGFNQIKCIDICGVVWPEIILRSKMSYICICPCSYFGAELAIKKLNDFIGEESND